MTGGVLLDSHTALWLETQSALLPSARIAIANAILSNSLFFSDISIWEIGVAINKRSLERRPDLNGLSLETWIAKLSRTFNLRNLRITKRVAIEAASVPAFYGSGDPGDCFLIATARVHGLILATHDTRILALAKKLPGYINTIAC